MTAPVQHPAWCHRSECTIKPERGTGAHVGKVRSITTDQLLISMKLYQGALLPDVPGSDVVLVLVDLDDPFNPELSTSWPMRLDAAQEFAVVLRALVRVAAGGQPNQGYFGGEVR